MQPTSTFHCVRAFLLFCLSVVLFGPTMGLAVEEKREQTEKWVKQIVDDFFTSVLKEEASALGLCSPELVEGFKKGATPPIRPWEYKSFRPWEYKSFTIISQQGAPDNSEFLYRVKLERDEKIEGTKNCHVVVRVAKEATGRWSIRYIGVRDAEEIKKER